ncbi:MAG: glycoside hydrolase family 13 protein [Bacteroidota bacterium]
MRPLGLLALLVIASACQPAAEPPASATPADLVPAWSQEAVWYQIFVERFRNGDPSNDPRLQDIQNSYPHVFPDTWQPTRWTQDWYAPDPWFADTGEGFYFNVQARRYGGDLQGVLDQLDTLADLGITAIYFNPLNDAPSLHKFDARNYRHIDRNFGPDPDGDLAIMEAEDPLDPATWQWTSADRLFLQVIEEAHARGIKVVVDYSWNHTGITFWAWQDVLENQADSPFAEWYQINAFDDPSTPENEFDYEGWAGVSTLPNLTKVGVPDDFHGGAVEGNLHPEVKAHVFNVTRRWLDPNGDGDPSDGIDGYRLDVAEQVPLGFWRDYYQFVKGINPDAYLVGEIWWEEWPDGMMDPRPWLDGVFDAMMNYRWYKATRGFLADAPPRLSPSGYVAHLDSLEAGIDMAFRRGMMNLTSSHDAPRFWTSVYNTANKYKYQVNPRDSDVYKLDKPDALARARQKLILAQQFTYYGAPQIWNGDEYGMWGADDPDNRKPITWPDLTFDDETALPFGGTRPADLVAPDMDLWRHYQQLIALRTAHLDLFAYGDLDYILTDDERDILGYTRTHDGALALVLLNASDAAHTVTLPWTDARGLAEPLSSASLTPADGALTLDLAPHQARILIAG